MNKKLNSNSSAGTKADSTATADDMQVSQTIAKPNVVCCFSFKSKTVDGRAARIETIVYDNDVVIINKVVVSTEDLTKYRFRLIRQYKWFGVYEERISLLKNSLLNVCHGIIQDVRK
jgi:hypothetical protein